MLLVLLVLLLLPVVDDEADAKKHKANAIMAESCFRVDWDCSDCCCCAACTSSRVIIAACRLRYSSQSAPDEGDFDFFPNTGSAAEAAAARLRCRCRSTGSEENFRRETDGDR